MKMHSSSARILRKNVFPFATIAICLFALIVSLPLFAQTTNGAIQGTVTDSSGAVVPNATITVRNTATGAERVTQSDSVGNYSVPSLPAGTYNVEIQASGL